MDITMNRKLNPTKKFTMGILAAVNGVLLLIGKQYTFLIFLAASGGITYLVLRLAAQQIKIKDERIASLEAIISQCDKAHKES